MMGFGPINPEPDEPVFHTDWERRALGLTIAASACGHWTIDQSRFARETLLPAAYLTKSYYEIWIDGLEKLLLLSGLLSAEELRERRPLGPPPAAPAY